MDLSYKSTEPEKVIPAAVTEPKVIISEADLRSNSCLITSELNGKAWQEKYSMDKTDEANLTVFIEGVLGKKPTVSDIKLASTEVEV